MIYQITIEDSTFITDASNASEALKKLYDEYNLKFPEAGDSLNVDPIPDLKFGFDPAEINKDSNEYYAVFLGVQDSDQSDVNLLFTASTYEELIEKSSKLNLKNITLYSDNAIII